MSDKNFSAAYNLSDDKLNELVHQHWLENTELDDEPLTEDMLDKILCSRFDGLEQRGCIRDSNVATYTVCLFREETGEHFIATVHVNFHDGMPVYAYC